MKNQFGITCIFDLEVFNKEDEVTFKTGPFSNTVLDNGLLKLFDYSLSDMCKYVNVGSSGVAVSTSQTGLINRLYSTNALFNSQEGAYYSWWPVFRGYKRVIQFAVGTCTGDFLEIGLSRLSNSDYFNRQRIKNSDGQDVLVRVKADEGLKITCDLRIYPNPATRVYSQVYKLDLKANTAGEITFSNGSTTRTLTYAQLTAPDTAKLELENLLGISSLVNYVLNTDNAYYIFGHPMNLQSLNLSIASHTLTGGTGAPELSVVQAYTDVIIESTFDFTDGITAPKDMATYWVTYVSGMNLLTMKLASASGTQFYGWGYLAGTDLTTVPFKSIYPRIVKSDGTFINPTFYQLLKSPSIEDYGFDIRHYYAPGVVGTGNQNVSGLSWYYSSGTYTPNIAIHKFATDTIVPQAEELEYTSRFSWGRYSQ